MVIPPGRTDGRASGMDSGSATGTLGAPPGAACSRAVGSSAAGAVVEVDEVAPVPGGMGVAGATAGS